MERHGRGLVPRHGGYRGLLSFQLARLIYDLTVQFCDRFIERRSRTHDQMVQAARSGVQNIAEGSQASGTSKKMELKLTNVARASLEELKLDYEDFLRQRGLPQWDPDHEALLRFKARRCTTVAEVRAWVATERAGVTGATGVTRTTRTTRTDTDEHGRARTGDAPQASVSVRECPCSSVSSVSPQSSLPPVPPFSSATLAANAALSLLNLCCHLLDRQVAALARAFETEGGFTERLYRVRKGYSSSPSRR